MDTGHFLDKKKRAEILLTEKVDLITRPTTGRAVQVLSGREIEWTHFSSITSHTGLGRSWHCALRPLSRRGSSWGPLFLYWLQTGLRFMHLIHRCLRWVTEIASGLRMKTPRERKKALFYQWKEVILSTGTDQMNTPGKLHLPAIKIDFFFLFPWQEPAAPCSAAALVEGMWWHSALQVIGKLPVNHLTLYSWITQTQKLCQKNLPFHYVLFFFSSWLWLLNPKYPSATTCCNYRRYLAALDLWLRLQKMMYCISISFC